MQTYSTTITKKEFVKELKMHQAADAFMRGTYSDTLDGQFKGCAVGCSLESISRTKGIKLKYSSHIEYEKHLGIPAWLAHVEDRLFENVSNKRAKTWPVEFAEAIPVGVNLKPIKGKFLIVVLESALTSFNNTKYPEVTKSINDVINLWRNGGTQKEFRLARIAAAAAAADADADADVAAAAAAAAAAADAAADAADAADAAAAAADAAAAAADADAAARTKIHEYFADELLKILREAK